MTPSARRAAAARASGSLHEITALSLATQVLTGHQDRNNLDTSKVDDVVLGCVAPVGEQGGDIARVAALNADYAESVAGVQIDRFCASGLEACNMAAAKVKSGEADMAIGGGVESMSRVPMGVERRRLGDGPADRDEILLHAARHRRRSDRHEMGLHPRRRRRLCGAKASSARRRRGRKAASRSRSCR